MLARSCLIAGPKDGPPINFGTSQISNDGTPVTFIEGVSQKDRGRAVKIDGDPPDDSCDLVAEHRGVAPLGGRKTAGRRLFFRHQAGDFSGAGAVRAPKGPKHRLLDGLTKPIARAVGYGLALAKNGLQNRRNRDSDGGTNATGGGPSVSASDDGRLAKEAVVAIDAGPVPITIHLAVCKEDHRPSSQDLEMAASDVRVAYPVRRVDGGRFPLEQTHPALSFSAAAAPAITSVSLGPVTVSGPFLKEARGLGSAAAALDVYSEAVEV